MLVGRLTKDPEVRYSQSAEPVAIARFTVAVNRRFKRDGEPDADFIGCVAFGKTGEFIEKYFRKGMSIGVSGRISVSTYDDAQGQRRWSTDVIVEEAEFTESRAAFEGRAGGQSGQQAHYDSMAERYTPPPVPDAGAGAQSAPPPAGMEGFAENTESIYNDDLPF